MRVLNEQVPLFIKKELKKKDSFYKNFEKHQGVVTEIQKIRTEGLKLQPIIGQLNYKNRKSQAAVII